MHKKIFLTKIVMTKKSNIYEKNQTKRTIEGGDTSLLCVKFESQYISPVFLLYYVCHKYKYIYVCVCV